MNKWLQFHLKEITTQNILIFVNTNHKKKLILKCDIFALHKFSYLLYKSIASGIVLYCSLMFVL